MCVFLGGDSYSPIKMESDTYGNPRWVGIKSVPWRDLIEVQSLYEQYILAI